MFSHMYAFVFSDLQPSFPLCERIRCLGATQNEGSIPFARSSFEINDLRKILFRNPRFPNTFS